MKFNGTHWLTGTGKEFPFDPNGLKPEEQAYSFGVSKEDSLKIKEWIASHDPHLRSSTFWWSVYVFVHANQYRHNLHSQV